MDARCGAGRTFLESEDWRQKLDCDLLMGIKMMERTP